VIEVISKIQFVSNAKEVNKDVILIIKKHVETALLLLNINVTKPIHIIPSAENATKMKQDVI